MNLPPYNLRNINSATEVWLHRAGVRDREEFLRLGAFHVYHLILEAGHEPDRNLLYALIGAIEDRDRREVAGEVKETGPVTN